MAVGALVLGPSGGGGGAKGMRRMGLGSVEVNALPLAVVVVATAGRGLELWCGGVLEIGGCVLGVAAAVASGAAGGVEALGVPPGGLKAQDLQHA